ncbi:hypothetical protein Tco_0748679 [Tanacetum coccineum]|uniref:Uncharacterized protein n=1 Tax=Tanacetum coccineum TaxID=301880 RepID=A0ABQ4YWD0_9ASTR
MPSPSPRHLYNHQPPPNNSKGQTGVFGSAVDAFGFGSNSPEKGAFGLSHSPEKGVLTPVRGESLKILNGFDVSLPVSHSLWSSQSFGHQKGETWLCFPTPLPQIQNLELPTPSLKQIMGVKTIPTYLQVVNHGTDLRSLYQEPFAPGLASSYVD